MKKTVILILAALTLLACSKDKNSDNGNDSADNPRKYITMTQTYNELSEGNSDLAFKLFASVNDIVGETSDPLVISPLSVGISLGMLANGADGETLDEILTAVGADSIDDLNDYNHTLVSQLAGLDKTVTLQSANSQWTAPDLPIYDTYSSALETWYDAEARTLDYDTAVSDINSWCGEHTNGLIKDFYSEGDIDESTRMILLNALYFKGIWEPECKFNKNLTADNTFHNWDGSTSTVPFMSKPSYEGPCYECDKYAVLPLYFGNEAYVLQILLPYEDVSLTECVESLDTDEWQNWSSKMKYMGLDVLIPKFSVKYKHSLSDALRQIGVSSMFDDPDFSNMSSVSLGVSDVKQESVFSIDEEGVEAASVTSSEMDASAGPPSETGEFHVDRPFLYLLSERSSNTILFIGRVTAL